MHNLRPMQAAFYQSESDQPHPGRARSIIKAHPEVRQLMVRNPRTALIALSVVVLQTSLAFWFGKLGFGYWWLSLVIAYCVGAFANHANYVIIHDATHNLIFRNKSWNKLVAILDCGKSLSEMLAEPWTNIAVQPPDSCAHQRAYLSRRFRQILICLA